MQIPFEGSVSFICWIVKAVITIFPFTLIYFVGMYMFGNGMKDITNRFLVKLKVLK